MGWWTTDRNRLDDELTVYVFVTNDLRTNYPPDEDDITGFARINDYLATQPEDSDYDSLLSTIRAIDPEARAKKPEFTFPASDGRIFRRYDELPDAASRAAMKRWLSAKAELDEALAGLSELRRQYNGNRSASLASRIRREESQTEAARTEVSRLRSDVHKALSKSR